jgi:hypothetical protein
VRLDHEVASARYCQADESSTEEGESSTKTIARGTKEEAESRHAADTAAETSGRSHASGSGARGFDADSWGP